MDSRKSHIVLDYSTRRLRKRIPWKLITGIFAGLALVLLWHSSRTPADISTAKEPFDGHFVYRGSQGQILQETIWRKGKLISAWETVQESRWINGFLIVDPPRWTQVIRDGFGSLSNFSPQGEYQGFQWYYNGDPGDGAG